MQFQPQQPHEQLKLRGQRCQTICHDIDEPAEQPQQEPQPEQLQMRLGQTGLTHIQQQRPQQQPQPQLAFQGQRQQPARIALGEAGDISDSDVERVLDLIHPVQRQTTAQTTAVQQRAQLFRGTGVTSIGQQLQPQQLPLGVSPAQQLEQNVDITQRSHIQPLSQQQRQQRIALGSSLAQQQQQRDASVESVLRVLHPARPTRPVLGAGLSQFQTTPLGQRSVDLQQSGLQLSSPQQLQQSLPQIRGVQSAQLRSPSRLQAPGRADQSDDLFDHDLDDVADD